MFTLLDNDDPSFVAFLVQQLLVPLASLAALIIVPDVPWKYVEAGASGQVIEVARCTIVSAVTGFMLGSLVQRGFPKARSGGKWIGAIPAVLMVWALVSDTHTFTFTKALADLFFPGPDGEGWWAFILLTCPTISTLCYSAAMKWPLFLKSPDAAH